jgi:hypothetical protein
VKSFFGVLTTWWAPHLKVQFVFEIFNHFLRLCKLHLSFFCIVNHLVFTRLNLHMSDVSCILLIFQKQIVMVNNLMAIKSYL